MTTGKEAPPPERDREPDLKPADLLAQVDTAGIRWFDLPSGGDPDSLQKELIQDCAGLEVPMLEDLLKPDGRQPYGKRWNEGAIRLVSTFAVSSPEKLPRSGWWCSKASTTLVYQPVELLASDQWLLTCWHPTETYQGGSGPTGGPGAPLQHGSIIEAVLKRLPTPASDSAGDLGVLVMNELALTYAPAYRLLFAALEELEFNLYGNVAGDPGDAQKSFQQVSEGLSDVWGARAVLQDRLTPINIPGLADSVEDRAWLPARDAHEIERVDNQIDRSLKSLGTLSDNLRRSFYNLRLLNADAHRDHREYRQRRIEILAAVFLIPTLIAGVFGANTWIPGENQEWGFIVMIICITILTGLAAFLINKMHEDDAAKLSKLLNNPLRDRSADP